RASSARKASATREKASHSGPKVGTATRMNANEPPQSPARSSSRARSPDCIDSGGGGCGCRVRSRRNLERELTAPAGVRALVFQQPLLAPQAATVTGQRTVGADDAMAGDN